MSFPDFDLKADQFFREKIVLSPMVCMFLSLPYQSNDEAETRLFPHTYDLSALEGMEERNLLVEGGEINEQDDHGRPRVRALFTPSGVLTRKMLLCFFAKWYQDPDYVFEFDRSTDARYYNQLASTFGYQNQKARQGKRYVDPLMQLIAARFTFLYYDTIEKAEFDLKNNANKLLFLKNDDGLLKIWRNPDFGFNCRFAVDFDLIKGMRKKVLFWNLYLFLVDSLPRIPEERFMYVPWEFFRQVAGRGYQNLAHFKQAVKSEIPDLITVYPALKKSISLRNPKQLEFIYAPPPI